MQNTWRRGLALGNAPDARILRWRYQHVGIFWRYLTLKFVFYPMPTPYASRWNITWPCTFHVFCVDFICVWYPKRTPYPVEYGLKSQSCNLHFWSPTLKTTRHALNPQCLISILLQTKKASISFSVKDVIFMVT